MISFKVPEIGDQEWVEPYLYPAENRGCEYNFVNLLIWKDKYHQKVAKVCDTVVVRILGSIGHSYLYPVGPGDRKRAMMEMEQDAKEHGEDLRLICLSKAHVDELNSYFPGEFAVEAERDSYDYLYNIDDLCELSGKRYQAKRNHIHRFTADHPDWSMEEISIQNIEDCLEMADAWYENHEGSEEDANFSDERGALLIAAKNFEAMGLEGLLIRAGGRVVAFTIGRLIARDAYDVFFEKAYVDVQGAYAVVNREFARTIKSRYPEVLYINREDDMGLEGLRRAKESYRPAMMEEKFFAIKRLS